MLRRRVDWIDDLLSNETVKRQGYFNPDTVERLKTMYRDEKFRIDQTFETDLLMIAELMKPAEGFFASSERLLICPDRVLRDPSARGCATSTSHAMVSSMRDSL